MTFGRVVKTTGIIASDPAIPQWSGVRRAVGIAATGLSGGAARSQLALTLHPNDDGTGLSGGAARSQLALALHHKDDATGWSGGGSRLLPWTKNNFSRAANDLITTLQRGVFQL